MYMNFRRKKQFKLLSINLFFITLILNLFFSWQANVVNERLLKSRNIIVDQIAWCLASNWADSPQVFEHNHSHIVIIAHWPLTDYVLPV